MVVFWFYGEFGITGWLFFYVCSFCSVLMLCVGLDWLVCLAGGLFWLCWVVFVLVFVLMLCSGCYLAFEAIIVTSWLFVYGFVG